jgi:hypothetical protein
MRAACRHRGSIRRIILFTLIMLALGMTLERALAAGASNFRVEIIPGPQCYDGLDNDGDGKIDYPDDPGCENASDNDETDPAVVGPGPGGGGGGGGMVVTPSTSVSFSGYCYPGSTVVLLKDAQVAATTIAGSDAKFQINLTNLSAGSYLFSLYGESIQGRRSSLHTFPISLTKGSLTSISGIVIAPTIATDKEVVRKGDLITIFGESAPHADVLITVSSDEEFFDQTEANDDGVYIHHFNSGILEMGEHYTKSKSTLSSELFSGYSEAVTFTVGSKNVSREVVPVCGRADLNCDGKVNLVDFSIAAYWYKRPLSGDIIDRERERLNADGKIDLVDFSIMAFYWTG